MNVVAAVMVRPEIGSEAWLQIELLARRPPVERDRYAGPSAHAVRTSYNAPTQWGLEPVGFDR